ncbi:hypothetical protein E3N88_10834 [Mikania micrantha]|uniref:DRBM domain-containing protein n=1 Tax=Mikania micrantha TaxID=192012 RepID=A0A5N6PC09_9ASTR|nr:hypothetical protein E3N88_10834 [Mikania micrantha]
MGGGCGWRVVKGFRSFVWTAISYQLKDRLKLSPSASQFVTSIAFFPWSIKPVYGILSDCIPIKGRKRIPYLVIATLLSLFPWIILGLQETVRNSRDQLMFFLLLQNLGSAMADVVIDAMIAEAARLEKAKFAGDLQSISWMAMALGGICGSLLGGHALSNLEMENIFLVFAVLPTVQLVSCVFVKERPEYCNPSLKLSASNGSNGTHESVSDEDKSLIYVNKTNTLRRNKSSKQKKKRKINRSNDQKPEKDGSFLTQLLQSIKLAGHTLFKAFRQPIILRPMAWFFLAQVTMPNLSTVMFYYQTEVLNLEPSFLGTTRVIGWISLMIGTFIYNRFLKKMKLRRILMFAHVALSLLTLLDIVLVTRLNVSLGVSDKTMMLFGSALSDAINQFKFMPFLILSGHLCPPGIEGTLFALFMSINNLGATISGFLGAGLASVLNISSGKGLSSALAWLEKCVSSCYVFKSRLQEYAQKAGLTTPIYHTIKEGPSHQPAAEQSAAEVALIEIAKTGATDKSVSHPVHETGLCKNLLQEYAQKMNYAIPSYVCTKDETKGRESPFSCTVDIGGIKYIGTSAKTKKEAELKAAKTALLAIEMSTPEPNGTPDSPDPGSVYTVVPAKRKVPERAIGETEEKVKTNKRKKFRVKRRKKKVEATRGEVVEVKSNGDENGDSVLVPIEDQSLVLE